MRVLVLDTETTGLPPRIPGSRSMPDPAAPGGLDAWRGCRIVQIAWRVVTYEPTRRDNGKGITPVTEEETGYTIYPDGFVIPPQAAAIHGITNEKARAEGQPLHIALQHLLRSVQGCEAMVAHNMDFDEPVIRAEMVRCGLGPSWAEVAARTPRHCTMKMGTLPGQRWPKLADLYRRLFGRDPEGRLHTAAADVAVCADIFGALLGAGPTSAPFSDV